MDGIKSALENADPFETWWPFVIAVVVGVAMTIRTIMGGQRCPSSNLIDRHVVVVTGGDGGIGLEVCKALAARSGRVVMACRDMEKADKLLKIMRSENRCKVGNECTIEAKCLDLRSFDSVRRFARDILQEYEKVDVLINNAGVTFYPYEKTVDGFETHLQVNYLAPFLLTWLLLPHLKKSSDGRIINVSAHAHFTGKMSFRDPLNITSTAPVFHPRDAFAHSKLAVVLATRHLAKLLKGTTARILAAIFYFIGTELGTNVSINACTPGLVRGTNHLRRSPLMSAIFVRVITYPWMWLFMKNPFEGAQCAIYMATEPSLKNVSGEYFNDCEKAEASELARDDCLAEKLFNETLKALRLDEKELK